MRLRITRNSAEEQLIALLNQGYQLKDRIGLDYAQKTQVGTFDEDRDIAQYRSALQNWASQVQLGLNAIFPTSLESSFFTTAKSFANISVPGVNQHFSSLFHQIIPNYLERLKAIVDSDLRRYTDLPMEDRIYVEHVDSFQHVRDVNPGMVESYLEDGFLRRSEDQVQLSLEQILDVSFHKKDWGGEFNDLYTANVIVSGARRATAFLPRTKRIAPGGMVFHALNRGVGRMKIFSTERDYLAFEETVEETLQLDSMRVVAYCLMPNHWHFVLWPENDGDLSAFLQRLTNTHTQRWQRAKRKVGYGHLYQGRFKSFPVETDDHFYTVVRYVERNALRANLVETAESWRWSSLWRYVNKASSPLLSKWPLPRPRDWSALVNQPQTEAEVKAVRGCIQRGRPFGCNDWTTQTATTLGLASTLRPRGRPKTAR